MLRIVIQKSSYVVNNEKISKNFGVIFLTYAVKFNLFSCLSFVLETKH